MHNQKGLGLIELILSTVIMGVIVWAAFAFLGFQNKQASQTSSRAVALDELHFILDRVDSRLRSRLVKEATDPEPVLPFSVTAFPTGTCSGLRIHMRNQKVTPSVIQKIEWETTCVTGTANTEGRLSHPDLNCTAGTVPRLVERFWPDSNLSTVITKTYPLVPDLKGLAVCFKVTPTPPTVQDIVVRAEASAIYLAGSEKAHIETTARNFSAPYRTSGSVELSAP